MPDKKEISRFIEVFNQLSEFEGSNRMVRGWGSFDEKDLPIPEVVKVIRWLTGLIEPTKEKWRGFDDEILVCPPREEKFTVVNPGPY